LSTPDRQYFRFGMSGAICALGESVTTVLIPLTIYSATKDATLSALLATAIAMGNILGTAAASRMRGNFSDRALCMRVDATCALTYAFMAVVMAVAVPTVLTVCCYCAVCLLAGMQTVRSGCTESYIGFIANGDNGKRQLIASRLRLFLYVGSVGGFSLASLMATRLPTSISLLIAGSFYLVSIVCLRTISANGVVSAPASSPVQILPLFLSPRLVWLTSAHAIASAGLFFLNGVAFFALVDHYKATANIVSLFFTGQLIAGVIGAGLATLVTTKVSVSASTAPLLRAMYAIPFLLVPLCNDAYAFMFLVFLVVVIHSFSIPIWQSMFQESTKSNEWRTVGAGRKALVGVVGGVSSAIAGFMYAHLGLQVVFVTAGVLMLVSTCLLIRHAQVLKTYRSL
jgi:hypothetical protein